MNATLTRQRGIALPVMLLMMLTMLATSIFLIKSINSTTLLAGNLAYESTLAKQADLGLVTGFNWLSQQAAIDRAAFNASIPAQGYSAIYDTTQNPSQTQFWNNAATVNDAVTNTQVDYVIHRMCAQTGAFDRQAPINRCTVTVAPTTAGAAAAIGDSLLGNSTPFIAAPQVHYVITSRLSGPRGGNVVNQLVVLIGG